MAGESICLEAERSIMIADCRGELEGDDSEVLMGDSGSRIRYVLRIYWWRQVRINWEKDRVPDMAREKWHLNWDDSSCSSTA